MRRFILDASIALAWFIDNPATPFALYIRTTLLHEGHAIVPALWHLEMANGLLVAERRARVSATDVAAATEKITLLLGTGAIETAADLISINQTLTTARALHLSAYDAVYLETAVRQGLPLATLDRALATAAAKAGVEVIQQRI